MSQRKLPLHKRWVITAKSFDALSRGKPPERTEQTLEAESFFNLFFFDSLILPNNTNKKKTTSSFVTKTHHFYHHFLLLLLLFIPTRSLFSPCVGEKVLLPLGLSDFQLPTTRNEEPFWWLLLLVVVLNRDEARARRGTQTDSILDFGNTQTTTENWRYLFVAGTRLLLREDAGGREEGETEEREEGETEGNKICHQQALEAWALPWPKKRGRRKQKKREKTAV